MDCSKKVLENPHIGLLYQLRNIYTQSISILAKPLYKYELHLAQIEEEFTMGDSNSIASAILQRDDELKMPLDMTIDIIRQE